MGSHINGRRISSFTRSQDTFERYADDCVCHCRTQEDAEQLLSSLRARFSECGLTLHPEKTKIVYCREEGRDEDWDHIQFTFLGYQFRCRSTRARKGNLFQGFNPGMAPSAAKRIRGEIRERTKRSTCTRSLRSMVAELNPLIRGWLGYYGHFRPSEFKRLVGEFIERRLMHWARWKYKRLGKSWRKAGEWFIRLRRRNPQLLALWQPLPE